MYNFRTDLADERNEIYKKANNISTNVDGIEVEEDEAENIKIGRVNIVNENGEQAIGKPQGTYVTLDIKNIKTIQHEEIEKVANVLANELRNLINKHITDVDDILVVGLGNIYVTPDALGPKVVPEIEVTRHILQYMPKAMPEDTRPVSAIAPGVLGITGIETMEILKGIVDNVKPKMLIVIDALASRNNKQLYTAFRYGYCSWSRSRKYKKRNKRKNAWNTSCSARNSYCCGLSLYNK